MSTTEIVENGVLVIGLADSAATFDPQPVSVLSTGGQTVAAVASLSGPTATFATSPAAFFFTYGKVVKDVKDGQTVSPGDILSMTGNVVAVIAAVGVVVGAPVTIPATLIGTALGLLGVVNSHQNSRHI